MDFSEMSEEDVTRMMRAALDERTPGVQQALNMGNTTEALALSLKKPPVGVSDEDLRMEATQLVMQVTNQVKSADIGKHLDSLDEFQVDLLLKYVYKGMSRRDADNYSSLLNWHQAIVDRTGLGSIVRAMAERRNVL